MLYYAKGSKEGFLSPQEVKEALFGVFRALGPRKRVLAIPPDFTRLNSYAGPITGMVEEFYGEALTDVLPALGTHSPMTPEQISEMFPGVPAGKFRVHDWRNGVDTIGEIPSSYVEQVSEGRLHYSMKVQVNRLLLDPGFDAIFSIGQVVPHEVVGMANHAKNIFVGTGGSDFINKSHFIGASYGLERIMGRASGPVRDVFEYARTRFAAGLPIIYILTVRAKEDGRMVTKGLFAGDDFECFRLASELSLETNFIMLDRPVKKCLVWLDPAEFKSTWLGNKAVYRTRMALSDDAELIILAPGLREFGEDSQVDALIRRYGYRGTPATLAAVEADPALRQNLGAPAHLIHGSSEGRFSITYAPGPGMSREEIEGVGYAFGDLDSLVAKYHPETLSDGWNIVDGEEIYYISNPALGLWACRERFK